MPDMDVSHIRQIDGTLLLVFQELLRERRATAAAARLGLTQSGISHALNRLRLLFGDELFRRELVNIAQRSLDFSWVLKRCTPRSEVFRCSSGCSCSTPPPCCTLS